LLNSGLSEGPVILSHPASPLCPSSRPIRESFRRPRGFSAVLYFAAPHFSDPWGNYEISPSNAFISNVSQPFAASSSGFPTRA
jgi:hypothetical protein